MNTIMRAEAEEALAALEDARECNKRVFDTHPDRPPEVVKAFLLLDSQIEKLAEDFVQSMRTHCQIDLRKPAIAPEGK